MCTKQATKTITNRQAQELANKLKAGKYSHTAEEVEQKVREAVEERVQLITLDTQAEITAYDMFLTNLGS